MDSQVIFQVEMFSIELGPSPAETETQEEFSLKPPSYWIQNKFRM